MKAKILLITMLILISYLNGKTQTNTIWLIPELGKQYIYEFKESTYILTDDNEKQNRFIKKKTFELEFDNSGPGNKEVLKVNITKNTLEKPDQTIPELKDYRFPYFQEAFPENTSPDFTETLLCRLTLKYSFDIETSKIELLNLEELLMDARKILREKGLSPGKIDNRIVDFNEKIIPQTTAQIQQIFQISQASFSGSSNTKNFDIRLSVEKPWAHLTQKRWEKESGLYSKEVVYEVEKRYLKKYNSVEIDSFNYPVRYKDKRYDLKYTENDIQLKDVKTIPQNRFTISGKIENLKNKKITLAVLRSPFGTQLFEESVFLDENNSFQIETELNHPQLVYLQFGNINLVDNLPMMAFYAEPGSRIHFEATGETFPWEVTFTGDFAGASKLLYDWRKEYNIFNQRLDWSTISFFSSDLSYSDYTKAFNNLSSANKNNLEEHAFEFVRNETKAYLFNILIYYLSMDELDKKYLGGRPSFEDINGEDFFTMRNILDTVNIYNFYNEYGIHSRQLAGSYLNYFFKKNRKVNNAQIPDFTSSIIISPYIFFNDLPQQVEMAKSILAGHPLYSILTELLLSEKSDISNQPTQFESYTQQKADDYFNLMTRICNDKEFISSIKEIIDNQQNWENENFVPANKFFNEKAEPVYMKDFFGEKPTIFYITNNWSAGRYFWDDLAKENPEINFVLVMEGSNMQEWLDYEKRAEPVAHQLFLVNEDVKLRDIFKSNSRHLILYDKDGVRIAFAGDPVTARDMAKQSLRSPAKQLDKSQLKIIIILLLILLTLLILSLLIWRWRVRQRFRKEQQQRRLRELELTAIRSQMNPHFLFNSLNSVQNLVQQNKGREAHLYLADFAGLIRKVLQNSEKEEVSLAEELEMTKQYLNLEKLRFDFNYSISVANEIDIANTMVPSMLIQPFVENAIIHGLQNKAGNRQLKIIVTRDVSGIKIIIEDNGIGREAAKRIAKAKNGKGSKLIKERLEILQQKRGEKHHLEIIDLTGNNTGTRVEIVIPDEN